MNDEKPLYQSRMADFELMALIYELPWFALGLAAGAGIGYGAAWFIIHNRETLPLPTQLFIMLGLTLIGLGLVFWAATLYPKTVSVFFDRIHFKMILGERSLPLEKVTACEALDFARTRSTFFSLRYRSLTPAIAGAVLVKRDRGQAWVFSVPDPGAFIKAMEKARSGKTAVE